MLELSVNNAFGQLEIVIYFGQSTSVISALTKNWKLISVYMHWVLLHKLWPYLFSLTKHTQNVKKPLCHCAIFFWSTHNLVNPDATIFNLKEKPAAKQSTLFQRYGTLKFNCDLFTWFKGFWEGSKDQVVPSSYPDTGYFFQIHCSVVLKDQK